MQEKKITATNHNRNVRKGGNKLQLAREKCHALC